MKQSCKTVTVNEVTFKTFCIVYKCPKLVEHLFSCVIQTLILQTLMKFNLNMQNLTILHPYSYSEKCKTDPNWVIRVLGLAGIVQNLFISHSICRELFFLYSSILLFCWFKKLPVQNMNQNKILVQKTFKVHICVL